MPSRRAILTAASTIALSGCHAPGATGTTREESSETAGTPPTTTPPAAGEYWDTRPSPTGNRTLDGAGAVRDADPVTFTVDGSPQWLVAHPATDGSRWTVVSDEGRAAQWRVTDDAVISEATFDPLPAGMPPIVATGDGDPRLVRPPSGAARLAGPVVAPGSDDRSPRLLVVAGSGDLLARGESAHRLAIDGLPDARIAALGDDRVALYGTTTDRYTHGALGDSIEGTSLLIVDATEPAIVSQTQVGPPAVFEGLGPLAADLDGDGQPEIVTTVADSAEGARIAVFDADANRVATGPVYGPGWRHQLTVAPFGPDGRPELAVVLKPHVDKTLEFYRLDGDNLSVAVTIDGFSTHTYGSRITDGAIAGDLDGDGRVEALVPTSERTAFEAVRRTAEGARRVWRLSLPFDDAIRSNVTGVTLEDGVAVGAAGSETVAVWQD